MTSRRAPGAIAEGGAQPHAPRAVTTSRRWRVLLVLGVIALATTLLTIALLTWLLRSGGGREFALARLQAALPAQALTWSRAEGTINGPLQLFDVRYVDAGFQFSARRIDLDLAPAALLGRRLEIEQLRIEGGVLRLAAGDAEDDSWPERFELPDGLPELRLPLGIRVREVQMQDLRIEQGDASLVHVQRLVAIGAFEHGRIVLERIDVDSDRGRLQLRGELDTTRRWASQFDGDLALTGLGEEALPVVLSARGDLRDWKLSATASQPEPVRVELRLSGGLPDLRWDLDVAAVRLDMARFGGTGVWEGVRIDARGDANGLALEGEASRDGRRFAIEPSQLRYADGAVLLQPLVVDLDPGRISAEGRVDLRADAPTVSLRLQASHFAWSAAEAGEDVAMQGQAQIDGPLDDYAIQASLALSRGAQRATLVLDGRGGREQLRIDALALEMPTGRLDAQGEIAWTPKVSWALQAQLRGFDPSWFSPQFPGAIDAGVRTHGSLTDSGPSGELNLDPLGGSLRGRALSGRAEFSVAESGDGQADIALRLGASNLVGAGRWGAQNQAQLELSPLHLADLLPEAAGIVRGRIELGGTQSSPTLTANLEGAALALAGFEAERLMLEASLFEDERVTLQIEADNALIAGQAFDQVQANAYGTRAQHVLELALRGGLADIDLELHGGEQEGDWQGQLRSLRIAPPQRPAWTLREPAVLARATSGALSVSRACLIQSEANLCVEADWQTSEGDARLQLQSLPLASFDPLLVALEVQASAHGLISGQAELVRAADGSVRGTMALESAQGGLRADSGSERDLLAFRDLRINATLDPQRLTLRAGAVLGDGGLLLAELDADAPLRAASPMQGRLEARLDDLSFLELISAQISDPRGTLQARLRLAGTLGAPKIDGEAKLSDFALELPALGIAPREGDLVLRATAQGGARIEGTVRSGEGALRIEGDYDPAPSAARTLQLSVRGENVTAAATPEFDVQVSPELELVLIGEQLRLRGTVVVPRARIDLEQLEGATAPSPDVVIVDAEQTPTSSGLALDSEVSIALGEDVRLEGFGLDGRVEGRITLRDQPGRASLARGGLQVRGEYQAYGQDLRITRGRLSYASTPIDNPALDIRAEREIDEVKVGVQVRGTALAPQLTLWSEPALDQAEQLSYLVLGRPLRSASQADGAQLSQAAAAFGGNLLAQRLGARMGLDEVGVADSRALGGAALTVGKFLSPKLYVSYGIALFGSGQVVTFKYLLSRVWSVQIDSGTENRATLNYRLER